MYFQGTTGGSDGKESACNAGDLGSFPGLERSHGEDPMEKGMATHFTVLAWRIPWTEAIQSMGLQRAGHR